MDRWTLFVGVVLAAAAVNGAYTAWAFGFPLHEEWMFYVDLVIPADVAAANGPNDVASRLQAEGYNATAENRHGFAMLVVTRGSDPDYQALFIGLGEQDRGRVSAAVQCRVAYMRDDCPHPVEPLLRAWFEQVVGASGLPLDGRAGHFGDEDFATFGEFLLAMGQFGLLGLSLVAVAMAGVYAREPRPVPGPFPPMK